MISPQQLEMLTQKKRGFENIAEKTQHDLKKKMERVLTQPGSAYRKSQRYNDLQI